MDIQRCRLQISGMVQGVGFRPHVYSLATRLGLSGFVGNDSAGVFLELQGQLAQLSGFTSELTSAPPPLARDLTTCNTVALTGGVMQNASVTTLVARLLRDQGFHVLEHRTVPTSDGGIALGQAAIALHRYRGLSTAAVDP